MNMWLLEVAMCEKCRSSHILSEGGDGGGGVEEKVWGLGEGGKNI